MPIDSQVEVKQVRLVKGTGAQIAAARQAGEILETDLVAQTDAPDLVTANTAITGATKCKITYDSKGLVTAGADLASSDITTALGYTPYNSTNPSGYQENVIETVKVNGTALTPSSKAVDITVPTVNNPTITITQGGVTKGSFTLNQSSSDTIALDAGGGSSLPSQTGHAGEFLTTDGTDASWATVYAMQIIDYTGD